MIGPPAWALPSRGAGASTLLVTVSGPGGIAEARRVATAAYVWARRNGAPRPDLDRICRVGADIVVPFTEQLTEELASRCGADLVGLYADGADSSLLGTNSSGAEVLSVRLCH